MPQLVLSRGNKYSFGSLKRFLEKIQMGPYFMIGSLILFVALTTVVTLMFSARQVTKGYVLNQLESEHQQLVRESERGDMEISKVKSLKAIEESVKVETMRRPHSVIFLDTDTAIASK